jgi:hypothetical protein
MSGTPAEKKIDIDMLVKEWSPEEIRRDDNRTICDESIVQSTIQGKRPIRGGDFIINGKGEAVTLAFAFQGSNEKRYGLTVGHIWEGKDDPVYAFPSNIPSPVTGKLPLKKVGKVATFSGLTDSMIFEFLSDASVDLYKVMIGPKTKLDLSCIDWSSLSHNKSTIAEGQKLCGFGAQRRGTTGSVACRFSRNDNNGLRENDIGIKSFNEGKKMISHEGDCGMIYFDEHGFPWSMHHVLTISDKDTANEACISWGVPLASIVEAHREYFGVNVVADLATQFTNLQAISPKKGSVIAPGAARFNNVEFLPGEEPNPMKYVTVGSGFVRFANVEIVSGQQDADMTESDMTDSYCIAELEK